MSARIAGSLILCVVLARAAVQDTHESSIAVSSESFIAESQGWFEVDRRYHHRHIAGNLERSISILESSLSQDPDNPQILWRLGRSLVRLGERSKTRRGKLEIFNLAREYLERSIGKAPAFSESHFWLGLALGRIGQTRGALKSLFLIGPIRREMRKTLELDPNHSGAHHVLGEVLRQIPGFAGGSKKGAVAELEKAVALGPNHTAHYPALAQAYLDIGERAKAVDILRKALDVKTPNDPGEYGDNIRDARDMLRRLDKGVLAD